jgi:hypothetical protein
VRVLRARVLRIRAGMEQVRVFRVGSRSQGKVLRRRVIFLRVIYYLFSSS